MKAKKMFSSSLKSSSMYIAYQNAGGVVVNLEDVGLAPGFFVFILF
jgi:hypothetical protein